jgi:multiple sugar transport system ATP-binding protein
VATLSSVALKDVTKIFPGNTVALDGVSLDVADGEFLAMLGPSGCGKSTLLRLIAGLDEPTSGMVMLDGEPVGDLLPRDRGVAMVFQDYALYPHMTVGGNIGFPLKLAGLEPEEQARRAADAASGLGIADLLNRRIQNLSGGQRQRVAMGRAIVRDPGVFLLDEPLSNLDAGLRAELRNEISGLARQLGVTVVYVTHDQTEALTMADRVAVLRRGVLQDVGTPADVYNRPGTVYVATFIGTPRMCLLEGVVQVYSDTHLALMLGEQTLYLPHSHSQARMLSRYQGELLTIGIRAEALTPTAPDAEGAILNGRITSLEQHGHETLVYLDVGALAIALDSDKPPAVLESRNPWWRRPLSELSARWSGRIDEEPPADEAPTGAERRHDRRHHRRRAELPLRLAPYPQISPGDVLSVAVDLEALHFFDNRGARIDSGWR